MAAFALQWQTNIYSGRQIYSCDKEAVACKTYNIRSLSLYRKGFLVDPCIECLSLQHKVPSQSLFPWAWRVPHVCTHEADRCIG